MHIFVLGASGYIGSHLVPLLANSGYQVTAAARKIDTLMAHNWSGVEITHTDAASYDSIYHALQGVDVAYYLIHSMTSPGKLVETEQKNADNFAKAASDAGVKRIIYLGALGPDQTSSSHLKARHLTSAIFMRGDVPVTEIRAAIIVGPGSAAFELIRDLVNNLPVMVTPKWVKSTSPPIGLSDLLYYLSETLAHPEMNGHVYHAAGPEQLSYEQLMRIYGEIVGLHRVIIPIPFFSPGLSVFWLRLITAVPMNLARSLVSGLRHDITANPDTLRQIIPKELLTYRQAVQACIDEEQQQKTVSRWVEGAIQFRDFNTHYSFYAKQVGASASGSAPPELVWRRLTGLGGSTGYYYLNWLWTLRESIDWVVGGPGRTRGRRAATELRVGDLIDSWRVIAIQPGRSLTLMMGMRAPGAGVLEFKVKPLPDAGCQVDISAHWHPAGFWGMLYWYALTLPHLVLFKGMSKALVK